MGRQSRKFLWAPGCESISLAYLELSLTKQVQELQTALSQEIRSFHCVIHSGLMHF